MDVTLSLNSADLKEPKCKCQQETVGHIGRLDHWKWALSLSLRGAASTHFQRLLPNSKSGFFFLGGGGRGSSVLIFKCWELIKNTNQTRQEIPCVPNKTEPRPELGSQALGLQPLAFELWTPGHICVSPRLSFFS